MVVYWRCATKVGARANPHWSYHGLQCVRLENAALIVDILPELGGKILHLIDKEADRDLLWQSHRVLPHQAALHANFDDHWCGGWDEIFPGGAQSTNKDGDVLPYLGELWTQSSMWELVEINPRRVELHQSIITPITPARWERRMSLEGDDPILRLRYRVENVGTMPFDFMFGIHPAQVVTPQHRIDLPVSEGLVDEAGGGLLGKTGDRYAWPMVGDVDMRLPLEPDARAYALHYLTGLREGWIATTDTVLRRGFGLCFDPRFFRTIWLWAVYGGWRGYYHVAVEPWTGYPSRLAEAAAADRALTLGPGDSVETEVAAMVYAGVDSVARLAADGTVVP